MRLVQSRIVTDDVEGLASFYAALVGASVTLNEYYVEVPAGRVTVGFCRQRFTAFQESQAAKTGLPCRPSRVVLDFLVDDVDAEYERIAALGVDWVMPPTDQPWGCRAMIFADPEGNLVNVFCPRSVTA